MQHEHCVAEVCEIDDAKNTRFIHDANFPNTLSYRRHRFPIRRVSALLHFIQGESRIFSGVLRKLPNVIKAGPEERYFPHGQTYQNGYSPSTQTAGPPSSADDPELA